MSAVPALALPASALPAETPGAPLVQPAARTTASDDFDLRTTTDTEIRRLRDALTSELLSAAIDRSRAEDDLAVQQRQHRQRRIDQRTALDAVEHLQQVSVQNAVSQFMNAQTDQQTSSLPSPTDNLAEATLSSYATDQLTRKRFSAAERLEQADLDVENAAQHVRRSRARLLETRHTMQATKDRLAVFEQRAAEHRRMALESDRRAEARSTEVDLRSVAGALTVNTGIEAEVDRLIADARLHGLDLNGGGFRTNEQQIRLRLTNCDRDHIPDDPHDPTDAAHVDYVVYSAPAETCSPPTAPPGQSEHQRGLAIDFTESGRLLTRSSPGYQWLITNAHEYGLFNLPSEPWHWSTTGR